MAESESSLDLCSVLSTACSMDLSSSGSGACMMVICSNVDSSLLIHEMSFMLAVATVMPALIVIGLQWLLAIMISVWPFVDSWFRVGTTSRELACSGETGCNSAMHGKLRSGADCLWNMTFVFVLLCGGRVFVSTM